MMAKATKDCPYCGVPVRFNVMADDWRCRACGETAVTEWSGPSDDIEVSLLRHTHEWQTGVNRPLEGICLPDICMSCGAERPPGADVTFTTEPDTQASPKKVSRSDIRS